MSLSSALLADGFAGDLPTLRLLQVAAGLDDAQAAAFCLVSPETYRRWRTDRPPNRTAIRLLAIRAGYLPWPTWRGWEVHGDRLFPPGMDRDGWLPGDLLAAPLWSQAAQGYRQEVERLRALLASWQEVRRRA